MSHVLIIGAGPAGASLSYLLATRGIGVTLVERRRDFAREFRGEVLMPSGVAALEQMGLAEALAALPSFRQQSIDIYLNRRRLFGASLDAGSEQAPRIVAVSQPALLEMLVERCSACPGFTFLGGASVRSFVVDPAGRVAGVRVRTGEGERDITADLVVGADGRHSIVRRQLELPAREVSPPMDIVWCKLPCPPGWRGVRGYAGRGHLLIAYHTWGDMLQLGWVILKGTFGDLRSRGIEEWVDRMSEQVSADLADHLRAHTANLQHPFLLDVVSDCATRWSAPGALVIGDAAHTMSPVGGQGINIALRDAIVAANHLVPLLSAAAAAPAGSETRLGARLDAALRAIEAERMPEVRHIQVLQARLPRLLLNRAWWGEIARRVLAAVLSRPGARRRAAPTVLEFFYGVTDVRLLV